MGMEIVLVLLLILANGVFAMTEIAIVSSRKVRLERLAGAGSRGAKVALGFANDPTTLLSTVQIGITLIGILTGAFGGATIAEGLESYFSSVPALAPYSMALGLAIVVSVTTFLSLIVGELVPKRIALNSPEAIATAISIPMHLFSRVTLPFARVLSGTTALVLRLLGVKESPEAPVTQEEIKILIAEGAELGTFEKTEQEMVEKIFRLGDMRVRALMTPKNQIKWLDIEDPDEHNLQILTESRYSRFPVGRGSLDDLVGIVYTKDLLAKRLNSATLKIQDAVRQPLFVPSTMRAFALLEMFKQSGTEIAIVVDEYGSLQGLVSLNDVLEKIVGDIKEPDETDDPEIIQRDNNSWLLDGMLPLDELKELFQIDRLPGEETGHFHTLGGFIMSQLGHIPKASEHFDWEGLRFEVVDMDRIRVDKVLVTRT
jgi:putative hemolysin